jgi:purine-cytosine permease-like protein
LLQHLLWFVPWGAIALSYWLFRTRVNAADEELAFPHFRRYVAPFAFAALAMSIVLGAFIDVRAAVRGELGNLPFSVGGTIVFAPTAFSLGALTGAVAWRRRITRR